MSPSPRPHPRRRARAGTAPDAARFSVGWLERREPADGRARSGELAALLAAQLTAQVTAQVTAPAEAELSAPADGARTRPPLVVHDLGSGTGSMARWLAPLLPGPQHWVLHDRDRDLLAVAAAGEPPVTAGGTPVTVAVRPGDVARLTSADLRGASLVTASALLDLLTADELDALAAACAAARCAALLTLSVVGRVELVPPDPLDHVVGAAFDAHQRRDVAGRRLLGPDAVNAAALAFQGRGAQVEVRPSHWRLGRADQALIRAWLRGWVAAACEQCPDLRRGGCLDGYLERRLDEAGAGALAVTVHHEDFLARWP